MALQKPYYTVNANQQLGIILFSRMFWVWIFAEFSCFGFWFRFDVDAHSQSIITWNTKYSKLKNEDSNEKKSPQLSVFFWILFFLCSVVAMVRFTLIRRHSTHHFEQNTCANRLINHNIWREKRALFLHTNFYFSLERGHSIRFPLVRGEKNDEKFTWKCINLDG